MSHITFLSKCKFLLGFRTLIVGKCENIDAYQQKKKISGDIPSKVFGRDSANPLQSFRQ